MSSTTYIRSSRSRLPKYEDCPPVLMDFLRDLVITRNLSVRTANTYYIDCRLFLRFLRMTREDIPEAQFDEITIEEMQEEDLRTVTREDVLEYMYFCFRNEDSANTRNVKLSSIQSFFDYLVLNKDFEYNPATNVKRPKLPERKPKYLTEEEARRLLEAANARKNHERDYCITSLFLHCGLRLSELVSLDVDHIGQDATLRIIGKGNKERIIFLNAASQSALSAWLRVRSSICNLIDPDAVFVSDRTRKRLTSRAVQKIIDEELRAAGLGGKGFSTHKLRHTAATLMYQSGTDVLELKEFLGHKNISTTEIYTHINPKNLRDAAERNPLNTPPGEQIGSLFEDT